MDKIKKIINDYYKNNNKLTSSASASNTLVLHDLYGGEIMKCICNDVIYYYNIINNEIVDITLDLVLDTPNYSESSKKTKKDLLNDEDIKIKYKRLLKYILEKYKTDLEKHINIINGYKVEIQNYFENDEFALIDFTIYKDKYKNVFKFVLKKEENKYKVFEVSNLDKIEIDEDMIKKIISEVRINKENINNIKILNLLIKNIKEKK